MSNVISQQFHGEAQEARIETSEVRRVQRAAEHLGASATIYLGDVSFEDIFEGRIPISLDSVVIDPRTGVQFEAADLVSQVRVAEDVSYDKA